MNPVRPQADLTFNVSPILRSSGTATAEDGHFTLIDHLPFIKGTGATLPNCYLIIAKSMKIEKCKLKIASKGGLG